mmetsp:Transcript_54997/g.155877  ORF Transcript_54997/g.155877 Transcript_54997/m.155877 type:complete len:306 (-) Transcript_54997:363-1280(-)
MRQRQHECECRDRLHKRPQEDVDIQRHLVGHLLAILGHPGGQLTRLGGVEEANLLPHQGVEQGVPKPHRGSASDPDESGTSARGEYAASKSGQQKVSDRFLERPLIERTILLGGDDFGDRLADVLRDEGLSDGCEHQETRCEDQQRPIRNDEQQELANGRSPAFLLLLGLLLLLPLLPLLPRQRRGGARSGSAGPRCNRCACGTRHLYQREPHAVALVIANGSVLQEFQIQPVTLPWAQPPLLSCPRAAPSAAAEERQSLQGGIGRHRRAQDPDQSDNPETIVVPIGEPFGLVRDQPSHTHHAVG